jgi:hypothetical protein
MHFEALMMLKATLGHHNVGGIWFNRIKGN